MKLVHPELEGQILLDVQRPCEWIIESPDIFLKFVQGLRSQVDGQEGRFVLSDGKEISLSKYAEMIANPLDVNVNDRKVLNKLYAVLSELAFGEELYLETQKILAELRTYFLKLEHASDYFLETDQEIDVVAVFKAAGIKVQNCADDFMENLCQYIALTASLLRKKLVILVNIRSYINDDQLRQLIKNVRYKEIALFFIENMERKLPEGVFRYIIDGDQCEIF